MTFSTLTSALLFGLAAATPVMRFPSPEEIYASGSMARPNGLEARQAQGNVNMCKENACGDCPVYFGLGSGYPECPLYYTDQFNDVGFDRTENGQLSVFMEFPQPDPGCKYIIRTPVVAGDGTCGAPTLVVTGAQCARIVLESTMLGQFCCGVGDCGAAGTPNGRSSSTNFVIHANGTTIEPMVIDSHSKQRRELNAAELAVVKRHAMGDTAALAERAPVQKRCGNGDFVVTRPRYARAAQTYPVSGTVTCPPTSGCSAMMGEEVTQTYEFSISVTVGDPLGIISATAGFSYSESISRSFSGNFDFGAGETGYVAFTPVLSCVEGYFSGDCDNNGEVFEACTATSGSGGGLMAGDLRGVIVRG